jgi:virulence-associated protein VagC
MSEMETKSVIDPKAQRTDDLKECKEKASEAFNELLAAYRILVDEIR